MRPPPGRGTTLSTASGWVKDVRGGMVIGRADPIAAHGVRW
jgi:hypothetical protein